MGGYVDRLDGKVYKLTFYYVPPKSSYPDMSVGAEETCTNFYPISPAIVRKSADNWVAWY